MSWFLRYTSHLGYLPPDLRPQFAATVGSDDPVAHVKYAASIGMAGVLYPWAAERSESEVRSVGDALEESGLACGCLVAVPLTAMFGGPWTDRSAVGRSTLEQHVVAAARTASSLKSTTLAVVMSRDTSRDTAAQIDDAAASLADMAGIAADHGLQLAVEPMCTLPDMLLTSTADAVELLRRADHPATALIFDTGHSATMGENVFQTFTTYFDDIAVLQLADDPGRVEPGAGSLPLVELAAESVWRGYTGLIDLEHEWSAPGAAGEAAGLSRLQAFDDAVRAAVAAPATTDK